MVKMQSERKGEIKKEEVNILKSQSAMEYLMTYGWAILIVAVVLAGLYNLGVFNGLGNTARAQPGSCQVVRNTAIASQAVVSLQGLCQGQLPQFVATFDGSTSYFNSTVSLMPFGNNAITITEWVYPTATSAMNFVTPGSTGSGKNLYTGISAQSNIIVNDLSVSTGNVPASANQWTFVAATYSNPTITLYVYRGGVLVGTNTITDSGLSLPSGCQLVIGAQTGACGTPTGQYFQGWMANIQVYNVSLSPAELQGQYAAGIGGAPIRPTALVAWYPLNGNGNDYSGFSDLAHTNGHISYNNNWVTTYT